MKAGGGYREALEPFNAALPGRRVIPTAVLSRVGGRSAGSPFWGP